MADKRNFRIKMNLACTDDELRPLLQHVYFENGFMIATEGSILVKAAVLHFSDFDQSEVDILNGKFLHRNTFKKIMSCEMVTISDEGIQDIATKDLYAFSEVEGKYPNYEAVIPHISENINHIGLTPSIAVKMFRILSGQDFNSVKLEFHGLNRAIKISLTGFEAGALTAILMPAALEG